MNIPYILIAIVALILLLAGIMVLLKMRGTPLVQPRYGRRVHIGIAIGSSLLLGALWLIYDLPIALLPVLIITQWITVFARRDSPPPKTRLILALVVGLTASLVLGTAVFWWLLGRS